MTDQTPASSSTPAGSTPPGWYPAPDGPYQRWWNGATWSEQTRPVPPSQPAAVSTFQSDAVPGFVPVGSPGALPSNGPATGPATRAQRTTGWVIAGTGAVVAVAAMLPWVTVTGWSVNGMDGDGRITLFLALVIVALGITRGAGVRGRGWALTVPIVSLIAAVVATLIGVVDWVQVGQVDSALTDYGWGEIADEWNVRPGIGLILTTLGGLAAMGASVTALLRNR